ncbi:hypothetical protein DID88_010280 [Monilinia fructigena]|uniref:Major facilitator superfamily (MFS) profile domain-containing protein n=1 Tax=Monilinia fructigena TaxID=38457 RepID=A0A395IM27_9HELO|nr:hypothetical protein DID88_010280 [Monilinia fructigena]
MLSFLDRSNIGNAKIAGLERDLHLDSNKYEWVVTAFYIAYICFEWMSILWKIIPAHIYITVIVLSWGIIASLQSIATSFTGLVVLRTLLGIGEAGFTGIPFYLSFFFKRKNLHSEPAYSSVPPLSQLPSPVPSHGESSNSDNDPPSPHGDSSSSSKDSPASSSPSSHGTTSPTAPTRPPTSPRARRKSRVSVSAMKSPRSPTPKTNHPPASKSKKSSSPSVTQKSTSQP